ncbi:uracil-DNA glycosylase [Ascodesmis nigricans]|uniref:Uracil-DNA glycosylase n=1 Tax=Ascodesmis nigricans TaxID=341454 RepID=A0A4V3SHN8_9PEZI|nr:uracil-DNA glycosylase [Ascodesmis nigricans]
MSNSAKRKATTTLSSSSKRASTITSFFTPKSSQTLSTNTSSTSSTSSTFDKSAWISKLTPEQRDLLQLEINTLHESWLAVLKDELVTPGFLGLKRFLRKEKEAGKKVFPPEEDVYAWSRYTPLETVKVVILGQDPYHGPNQAMGLSFSVRSPTPAPPSLQNIYKSLHHDYPSFTPPPNRSGLLTPWASRGVLMLNACLTVVQASANSHSGKGWEALTQKVIEVVAKRRTRGVVFMAWGSPAGKRVAGVEREKGRHCVLKSVHPSPLSAHKGFLDCGHFKAANEWLQTRYGDDGPIDWSLHGPPVGIPQSRISASSSTPNPDPNSASAAPATKNTSTKKKAEKENEEDYFDNDEEEAMMAAVAEAERKEKENEKKAEETAIKKEKKEGAEEKGE